MVRIHSYSALIAVLLVTQTAAQTGDPLGSLISEAYSVYTEVTGSYLPSVESAASAAASSASAASVSSKEAKSSSLRNSPASTTPASSESPRTSHSSPSKTASSITASSTSSTRTSSTFSTSAESASTNSPTNLAASATSASSAAAASASSAASSSKHHGSSNTLAIALGVVLGALALGLLILVLLLCCRRRRRRRDSVRHSALSPSDEEVHSWRRSPFHEKHPRATDGEMVAAAPLMSEHPAYRNNRELENPFADPVPAERQLSAPNSRAGLTDGTVVGDDPYLMDKNNGTPIRKSGESHHGAELAAGLGGAALGAAAMHHHNKHENERFDEKHDPEYGRSRAITRKPLRTNSSDQSAVPAYPAMAHNDHPAAPAYPTTTANDDAFALNRPSGRRSMDSARSRPSRDAARANAAFDNEYAPTSGDHHHGASTAAALGAGALVGAAAGHHKRNRSRSNSHSRSPRRQSLLASKERHSDNSNTSSDSYNSNKYSDALAQQTETGPNSRDRAHDLAMDVPPTPPTRSRRNSALGTAAPAAAIGSYHNYPRERSTSRPRSYPTVNTDIASANQTRTTTPPAVPSRSPHRTRFSGEVPRGESPLRYQLEPYDIGNPYDDAMRGNGITAPPQHHRQRSFTAPVTVGNNRMPMDVSNQTSSSDDSNWRLSHGMPGGWQRAQPASAGPAPTRRSMDMQSPVSAISPNGNSAPPLPTNRDSVASGRRLRLADLRRDEEERERMRSSGQWFGGAANGDNGRKAAMSGEWSGNGNGGYDGFDPYARRNSASSGRYYEGHEGVGQAL